MDTTDTKTTAKAATTEGLALTAWAEDVLDDLHAGVSSLQGLAQGGRVLDNGLCRSLIMTVHEATSPRFDGTIPAQRDYAEAAHAVRTAASWEWTSGRTLVELCDEAQQWLMGLEEKALALQSR